MRFITLPFLPVGNAWWLAWCRSEKVCRKDIGEIIVSAGSEPVPALEYTLDAVDPFGEEKSNAQQAGLQAIGDGATWLQMRLLIGRGLCDDEMGPGALTDVRKARVMADEAR